MKHLFRIGAISTVLYAALHAPIPWPSTHLEFSDTFLECVDEALRAVGEDFEQTIYWHLGHDYDLPRESIPSDPESLHEALSSIFGASALVLERSIVGQMRGKFRIPPAAMSLVEAVSAASLSQNDRSSCRR